MYCLGYKIWIFINELSKKSNKKLVVLLKVCMVEEGQFLFTVIHNLKLRKSIVWRYSVSSLFTNSTSMCLFALADKNLHRIWCVYQEEDVFVCGTSSFDIFMHVLKHF